MQKKISSIHSKFIKKMIMIVFIAMALGYLAFIHGEYSTFKSESASLRSDYIKDQKIILKREVTSVVNDINTMKNQSRKRLKIKLKERVCQAHKIAMNIYRENAGTKSLPEIEKMIKDALRPVRFDDGKGYYFAVSMNGVEQLYPVKPQLEGKNLMDFKDSKGNFVIQNEIQLIKTKKEGFIKNFWAKSGEKSSMIYPKLSFVKYFKPLNWYFGTGVFIDEFEKQTKQNILQHIVNLRFGTEGYFFGNTYNGDPLFTNGRITTGSENIWKLTYPNGIKIIQKLRQIVQNSEGGFLYYSWHKLNNPTPSPKMSFVKGISDWKWIIGAGVYLDTIDKIILNNKTALNNKIKKRLIHGTLILSLLLLLIFFWSKRLSNQMQESSDKCISLLKKAGNNSTKINLNEIKLVEFKDIAISINKILKDMQKAEEKLRKSEKRYRSLFENAVEGFFQSTPEGRFINVNPACARIFGYETPEELISNVDDIEKQIYLNSSDRYHYEKLIKENGSVMDLEFQAKHKDGSQIWVSTTAHIVYDENNKIIRYEGSMVEITKRKKAESEQKRLLAAIEHSSEIIMITDINGDIQYVNPAFEKTTGFLRKEVLGKNPRILKSGKQDMAFYDELWQTITSGRVWHGRIINKKKNNTFYTEDVSISPVFDDETKEIVNFAAVKRDITNDIIMDKKLHQSQKMESIGVLAGGIAHDFNNILFPITGYTQMLMEEIPGDSPLRDNLNSIYRSALRASDLVRQILTFAREDDDEMKLMQVHPIVKEALKMIRATIPATITIKQNIDPHCGAIKANPTQIHQIVMNLTTNAYHAMEESGGEMTIILKKIEFEKSDVANILNPDIEPGNYICLSVIDTGTGMDKETIGKIFDPFFTTKEKGKGTGMGLAVVHGIVKSTGGAINVYSEPGKGTKFDVYLPVAQDFSSEKKIRTNAPIKRGTGNILLVDDENEIIKMETHMLERLGYTVTSRTSSIEALELFKNSPHKFDLVITDMAMPNLSGDRLAVELIKIRPNIPILLCTGFSETMTKEKATSLGIKDFLLKPITMIDLSNKIGKVLDKKEE